MKKIFGFLITLSLVSFSVNSSTIDHSDCEGSNICIGQNVIAYYDKYKVGRVPYIGRVVGISKTGDIEIDNGAPARNTIITKEAFKEVKCLEGVCSNQRAVNLKGNEYDIRQIFANGAVLADQGNPNYVTYLKSNELFNECKCIGKACLDGIVISPNGERIKIDGVYKNGTVRSYSRDDSYYKVYTLKELGFGEKCTSESPCSCSENENASLKDATKKVIESNSKINLSNKTEQGKILDNQRGTVKEVEHPLSGAASNSSSAVPK
ncbi:MAG: hypothetical protein EHM20_08690 [Alphaproteobacteria bacterium]|nr:MAG: hypothetical protein EHM20_08690 [Alphaproteobacteria bacterium]